MLLSKTIHINTKINSNRILGILFGFSIFIPQPCVPLGSYNSIQLAHLVMIAILWSRVSRIKSEIYLFWLIIILPFFIAMVMNILFSENVDDIEIVKVFMTRVFESLPFIVTGLFISYYSSIIRGAILGISVQMVIYIIQLIYFTKGIYPEIFLLLQNNPQYGVTKYTASNWVIEYRANGLMPESSAFWACLSPWLFIIISYYLYLNYLNNKRIVIKRIIKVLLFTSCVCIFLSRSGYIIVFGICSLLITYKYLSTKNRIFLKIIVSTLLIIFLFLTSFLYEQRVNYNKINNNQSWNKREKSLVLGYYTWKQANFGNKVWGFMENKVKIDQSIIDLRFVTSVILKDITRTGILGILSWLLIIAITLKSILTSKSKIGGLSSFIALFAGLALFTGYSSLMPFWAALSYLMNWDKIKQISKRNILIG
jgi:hypothetical protein